jgi:hypothetical protein
MKWKLPPKTKIYEALGAVVDERIEIDGNTAKVWSSSRNKYYDITYDEKANQIMTNDNASYWKGYLGYPAIALLMKAGKLSYTNETGNLLKGIAWKDINQKYKNNFEKALEEILSDLDKEQRKELDNFVDKIYEEIEDLNIGKLGKRVKPPSGY